MRWKGLPNPTCALHSRARWVAVNRSECVSTAMAKKLISSSTTQAPDRLTFKNLNYLNQSFDNINSRPLSIVSEAPESPGESEVTKATQTTNPTASTATTSRILASAPRNARTLPDAGTSSEDAETEYRRMDVAASSLLPLHVKKLQNASPSRKNI